MNYLCFVYTIHVENIRTRSFHGCLPEEGVIGGDYKTDVWIELMDNYRITKDTLEETVDYGVVTQVVVNEMNIRSKLVETGIKTFYFLVLIAGGLMVFNSITKLFKK